MRHERERETYLKENLNRLTEIFIYSPEMNFVHEALTIAPTIDAAATTSSQQCRDFLCAQFAASKVSTLCRAATDFDSAFRVHPFTSTPFSKLSSSCTPCFFKRVVFLYCRMGTPKSWFFRDRAAIMHLLPCCAVVMKVMRTRRSHSNNTESSILTYTCRFAPSSRCYRSCEKWYKIRDRTQSAYGFCTEKVMETFQFLQFLRQLWMLYREQIFFDICNWIFLPE